MQGSESDKRAERRATAKQLMRWMKRKGILAECLDDLVMDQKHQEANHLHNTGKYLPRLEYLLEKWPAKRIRIEMIHTRRLLRRMAGQQASTLKSMKKKKRR